MALRRVGLIKINDTVDSRVDSEGCAPRPFAKAVVHSAAYGAYVQGMLGGRNTALHVAAASKRADGHGAIVSFLIAERADVNQANKNGCAAQLRARRPRRRRVSPSCSALRRQLRSMTDLQGSPSGRYTALHYAAINGNTDAAVRLLVSGADQNIKNNDGIIMSGYATPPVAKRRPHTIVRSAQANASPGSTRIQ